jgi:hypothetical protein
MYPVIPAGRGIRESLKPRLGRRSGNSHFTSSEKRQSTCTFCFCHGDIKVRPKAIEVNRPYLFGMRADRRPRPDIFRPTNRHRRFRRRLAPRPAIRCSRRGTNNGGRSVRQCEKYCRGSAAARVGRREDQDRQRRARSSHRRQASKPQSGLRGNSDKADRCGAAARGPRVLP